MIQFLICLFLISEAHKGDAASDAALVKGVKDTLDVCSDIVEAVGDFLSIFETEERRRDSLGVRVVKKLKVCRQLVELVDAFRKNPAKFDPPTSSPTKGVPPTSSPTKGVSPTKLGLINLQLSEVQWLDEQLRSISKKLGETVYIASSDGDDASVFHKKSDDQGPTVVVVQSTTGAVFGGYTDLSWKGKGRGKSFNVFLFRIRPTALKLPQRFKPSYDENAVMRDPRDGPVFGTKDLVIKNQALRVDTSSTKLDIYGIKGISRHFLNMGTEKFQVRDYVVIKAIKI